MLVLFTTAFLVALGIAYLIVRFQHMHSRFSADHAGHGRHKIHHYVVPRIGGIAIAIGFIAAIAAAAPFADLGRKALLLPLAIAFPSLAVGLLEDLTKAIRPVYRLSGTFVSAILGYALLDAQLLRLDVALLDPLLLYPAVSLIVTLVMVGGVAHAINIIDGLNGLSGVVCVCALAGLAAVAWYVGDAQLMALALITAGAAAGFFCLNFPHGRLFCGDGGAYFLGFMIAEIAVLLIRRHPEVSAWFPLMLVAYPVWETLFSAYRRSAVRGCSSMLPDRLHLHTIVFRSLTRGRVASVWHNSKSSVLLWPLPLMSLAVALTFWRHTPQLIVSAFCFVACYVLVYRSFFRRRRAEPVPVRMRLRVAPQAGRRPVIDGGELS